MIYFRKVRLERLFAERTKKKAAEYLANLRTSNQACSAIEAEHDHREQGTCPLPSGSSDQTLPDKPPTQ